MPHEYPELPIDIRRKAEVVQDRISVILMTVTVAVVAFLIFIMSVLVGSKIAMSTASLPDISSLEDWRPSESTRIYDRNGTLVANIHGDEDRVVVPLSEISPHIQRAVMAIEDNRFFHHDGIDLKGTFRALVTTYVKKGDVQGGSTITQQLVKNLFLSPEKKITRKIAEAILSMRVEKRYSKHKILELYLNQVYFGNQSYGIEKASRRYYRKSARDITIAESAMLAGLLKAPEGLSPYAYPEAAEKRKRQVLAKMLENGYITPKQYKSSMAEEITFHPRKVTVSSHPYFIAHVIQELEETYGSDLVRRGGLQVYTTMDKKIQTAAEKALEDGVTTLPKYTKVTQGALVTIDVETAEVLAMVGGIDFQNNQFNNATQARRAAGSTFKPFVYLTGFRLGMINPETMISDRPISFNTGVSIWRPKNWDGKYMGSMTIRKALTLSRNTPTVQIGMKVGIDEVIKTARLAGVESRIDRNFSSLLGSSGFSPLEMATAYTTFARGGIKMKPTSIRRLEDSRGREIAVEKPQPERVFDPDAVANLVSILVDVVQKGTGRNAILPGREVAGKTGTTDKVRDVWFAGMTPDMVTMVWMGNDKYEPLKGVFSSNAAKVFGNFAKQYYEIRPVPPTTFPEPQAILVKRSFIQNSDTTAENAPNVPVPVPPPGGMIGPPAPGEPPVFRVGAGVKPDSNGGGFAPVLPLNNSQNKPAPSSAPAPQLQPLVPIAPQGN